MSLPDYLYEEIFDHLDFHALIRLRRAIPEFSPVLDPLLKLRIAQICVKNLKTKIETKMAFLRSIPTRTGNARITVDRFGDFHYELFPIIYLPPVTVARAEFGGRIDSSNPPCVAAAAAAATPA